MSKMVQEWQNEFRGSIGTSWQKLWQVGINSGYAIIAAAAILPVLAAGSVTALSTMVGSIGANLISNLVQGAKDEVDLARRIQSLPANDQTLDAINELLAKLDALGIARQELPESDWERLESLLDQKLGQYIVGGQDFRPKCDAPILTEKVDRRRAREIAFDTLNRAWWSERQVTKYKLELCHWPMAFYDAPCLVKYQDRITEKETDSEGEERSITRTEEGTDDTTVQVVVFPSTPAKRSEHLLPIRVYNALNGLELERELDWGGNKLASWGYRQLCLPALWSKPPNKVKQMRYWENGTTDVASTPGRLDVAEQSIIEDARHVAKRYIVTHWKSRGRSVIDVQPGTGPLRIVKYPFWLFEAGSVSGACQVVIDALVGKPVFIKGPASRRAYILASLVAVSAIAMVVVWVVLILVILLFGFGSLVSLLQ